MAIRGNSASSTLYACAIINILLGLSHFALLKPLPSMINDLTSAALGIISLGGNIVASEN